MSFRGGINRIPFWVDVARDVIDSGWDTVHKFGENPSIGTSLEEVWDGGGSYTGWLQAADSMVIAAGGDGNDTAAGTGARSVTIQGLDENWNMAQETVATAGASESAATTTTFIRVFRAWVETVGAYGGTNAGDISIATDTAGTQVARILAGNGQTNMALYTIPAGSKGLVVHVSASVDTSKTASVKWYRRNNADDVTAPMPAARIWHTVTGIAGAYQERFDAMPIFGARTDLWVSALTGNAAGDPVQSDMAILLVPE